ncbi:hypothetical protein FACS18945_2070 [Bacteroidia bacterium]|nr:hypothetical protein FACS189434_03690 [Bacteroidia bacterium]GHT57526.1 hypothetical protein FACS18945_2070 [Bacteroidia bacterium]
MTTATIRLKPTVTAQKINWTQPAEKAATVEEFREMIRESENGKFISFEQHHKNMNEWLRNHL